LNALHAAPDNWAGAYVGGNLGYGIGHNPSRLGITDVLPLITAEAFTLSPAGVTGGAQAGYNWQAGHLVAGVEGDFQGANQKDSICMQACVVPSNDVTAQQKLSWFGTVRGRIGYAAGPALLYATGGYAVAGIKTDVQTLNGGVTTAASFDKTLNGWVLGGGIETMFAPNWSTKLEYLYTDYGSVSNSFVSAAPFSTILNSELHNHVVRAGVNYHFGG
jgi:outer membrane immunogenic protein